MSTKAIFGSVIAVILLGLYVYLIWVASGDVGCTPPGCTPKFTEKMSSALSLIAGLVGALVIAELAITEPGEAPMARVFAQDPTILVKRILKVVTTIYIGTWILAGLGALLVSLRNVAQPTALTNLGESWFGLAIAASYSYFGLQSPARVNVK